MAQSGDDYPPKAKQAGETDSSGAGTVDPLDELARLMGAAGLEPPRGSQRAQTPDKPLSNDDALLPRDLRSSRELTDDQLIEDALADGDILASELDLSEFDLQPGPGDDPLADTDELLADLNFSDLLTPSAEPSAPVPPAEPALTPPAAPAPPAPQAAPAVPAQTAAPSPSVEPTHTPPVEAAAPAAAVSELSLTPDEPDPVRPQQSVDEEALLAALDEFSVDDDVTPTVTASTSPDVGAAAEPFEDRAGEPPLTANMAAAALGGVAGTAALSGRSPETSNDPLSMDAPMADLASDPDFDPGAPPLAPRPNDPQTAEPFEDNLLEEYDQPEPKKNRSTVFTLAALGVLALGGAVAYGVLSGGSAEGEAPQLIAADDAEIKVEQTDDTADQPAQPGDAVFSALDEQGGPADDDNPRIVLPAPGAESLTSQVTPVGPAEDIAPAPPGSTASRPVRTVTVLADGTVVDVAEEATETVGETAENAPSELAAALEDVAGVAQQTAEQTVQNAVDETNTAVEAVTSEVLSTRAVETIAVGPNSGPQIDPAALQQVTPQTEVATVPELGPPAGGTPSIRPPAPTPRPSALGTGLAAAPVTPAPAVPAPSVDVASTTPSAPTAPATPSVAQTPSPAQPPSPVQLTTPQNAPLPAQTDQSAVVPPSQTAAPAQTASTQTATVAPAGDWVVQLASLRSEEQASSTFSSLQGRFGSILSGYSPDIQRVDLGDRGIFHRLRIGPMDRASANSLCQRYQSAGGECFVQRR
ncbi:MAG: SPOR domain-containing protein [Pseudomonadota bacterium]